MSASRLDFCLYRCVSERAGEKWRLVKLLRSIDLIKLSPMADVDEVEAVLADYSYLSKDQVTVSVSEEELAHTLNGRDLAARQYWVCDARSGKPLLVIDPRRLGDICEE